MRAKPPKLSQNRLLRIYEAILNGADLRRCNQVVSSIPAGLNTAECILIAAQIAGTALGGMSAEARGEMLQGLFVAIDSTIREVALMNPGTTTKQ